LPKKTVGHRRKKKRKGNAAMCNVALYVDTLKVD